jgi:AcrR family transcriptional regulator
MTQPTPSSTITGTPVGAPDGRTLRRERNIAAARSATLELRSEGVRPSLGEIAERAGLATRSVYRYFGDADAAIADAVTHRRNRAIEVFKSEPSFGRSMPLNERVAMLILRRIRLERLVHPLAFFEVMGASTFLLDIEVREAFFPELAVSGDDEQLALILCATFRLHSVCSMRYVFGDADELAAEALSRLVLALLVDAR